MATPKKQRRDYGAGAVYQRHDHPTCPPLVDGPRDEDGKVTRVRPRHKCQGLWVGSFEAGWNSSGTRRRVQVSAKTEAKCKAKLRDKRDEYLTSGASTMSDRTTVKAYAEKWLEDSVKKVRPTTHTTDKSAIRQWIVPTIGNRRLRDLNANDVRKVEAAQRDAGRKPGTMIRTHSVLVKMLRAATVDGATIHAGVFNTPKATGVSTDREAIPTPDALALLRRIEAEPDPSRWVAVILNGLRQGERLGLTWPMVDFENHVLDISWQLQPIPYIDNRNKHLGFRVPDDHESRHLSGRFHLTRPKTASGRRFVPMTLWFEAALLRWRDESPESPLGLVWPGPDGLPIDAPYDREDWYDLQRRAGITHPTRRTKDGAPAPYYVHEGRHTTVTMLKELGVDDETIEQIVGQAKLVKDYAHHNMLPKSRAALEALAERLALRAVES